MKESNLKSENFTIYVKKVTKSIPGLRFSVQNSLIVLEALQLGQ